MTVIRSAGRSVNGSFQKSVGAGGGGFFGRGCRADERAHEIVQPHVVVVVVADAAAARW